MKKLFALGLLVGLAVAIGCEEQRPPIPEAPFVNGGLPVGTPAPEIVGVDLEGVEFKLSDYRGKVIMLDFYGDW